MKVVVLLLALCCFHQISAGSHSLKYFYTGSSGTSGFPEFVAVGMVDEVQFIHFDSNSKQAVPKQDWVNDAADPQYWERQTQGLQATHQSFKASIDSVKQRFNQTEGVHTVQQMYGCQWNDESEATDGFEQFGYDGEDFITLDLKNQQYIASTPQTVISKHKLESNRGYMEGTKAYLTMQCIDWLKKYLQYGSSFLERKVRPKVTLLQKHSKVVCHATDFYPEAVMITWKRDGEEMLEDVDVGETLPNEDGTFQKRAVLTVSPEEFKNRQYTCEVAHKSGETIIVDEIEIQPRNPDSSVPVGTIIGVVVPIVLIVLVVAGFFILRKKKNADNKAGFSRANTDESSQSSGEKA